MTQRYHHMVAQTAVVFVKQQLFPRYLLQQKEKKIYPLLQLKRDRLGSLF